MGSKRALKLSKEDLARLERDVHRSKTLAVPVDAAELFALIVEVRRHRRAHNAVAHTVVCNGCGWACYLDDNEHPTECPVCRTPKDGAPGGAS